jgi:predicted ATPase
MKIEKIHIDKFKRIRNFNFYPNENINVITGTNNCGKTTILEAVSLWYECFRLLIVKARRSDYGLGINNGDFRFGKKSQNYFDYRKLSSVRSNSYGDIFYSYYSSCEIGLTIKNNTNQSEYIGFRINSASGNNYEIHLENHNSFNFRWLNDSFNSLPNPIGCFFSSPVAAILPVEEFELKQKIYSSVDSRQTFIYLRNRLFLLSKKRTEFRLFQEELSYIINNSEADVKLYIDGKIQEDLYVNVKISLRDRDPAKDISLLGSGTLQIIEILLHSYEEAKDFNVILLDEPDSHIHRDIQKRLIKVLSQKTEHTQLFMTTHNESLIRSVQPQNIFHIDDSISNTSLIECKAITNEPLVSRKTGISPSYHSKVIRQLGNESSLDLLNAIEADRIVIVEGTDDAEYIQSILNKKANLLNCVYWSFGGLDTLIKKILYYKDFLSNIGCSTSLWDKCILVIDADFMTDDQKEEFKNKLIEKLNIPCFIWKSYTLESSVLREKEMLTKLVFQAQKNQPFLPESFIATKIDTAIEEMKTLKTISLNSDHSYRASITGQIQNRANAIRNDLGMTRVINGGEAQYFQNYELFAKSEFDSNRIDHLCNKDDIERLLAKVYCEIWNVKDEKYDNHFSEILDNSSESLMFNEWNDLNDTICN